MNKLSRNFISILNICKYVYYYYNIKEKYLKKGKNVTTKNNKTYKMFLERFFFTSSIENNILQKLS